MRHAVESLARHEYLGEAVREKLIYYPAVTREAFPNRGRLTALIQNGRLFRDLAMTPFDARTDRVMICGSPAMLADTAALLDERGIEASPAIGEPGDYIIERAFVAR